MSDKCQRVFDEILTLVPTANFSEIRKKRGGKLRYPIYISMKNCELQNWMHWNCLHVQAIAYIGLVIKQSESWWRQLKVVKI